MKLGRKYLSPADSMRLFALGVCVFTLASLVAGVSVALTAAEGKAGEQSLWVGTAMGTLSLLAATLIFCGKKDINFPVAAALNKPPRLKDCLIGTLFVIGLIMLILPLAIAFTEALNVGDTELPFDTYANPISIILSVLCVCVFAGVAEEIFIRGVVTRGFSRYGLVASCALSGLLFMLLHMNPAQTVYQFVLGAALGFVALWGGNTWVCVIMHFVNNAITLLMGGVMSEGAQVWLFIDYWYVSCIIGTLICATAAYLYVRFVPNVYDKQGELKLRQDEIDAQPLPTNLCYEPDKEEAKLSKTGVIDWVIFALAVAVCLCLWIVSLTGTT